MIVIGLVFLLWKVGRIAYVSVRADPIDLTAYLTVASWCVAALFVAVLLVREIVMNGIF